MDLAPSSIKRPEPDWPGHYYPRRYWNFFLAGSIITHLFVIAVFYNASLFSLVDLLMKKTEAPQMLYVGVVEPERPVQPAVSTEQEAPVTKEPPARSAGAAQNAGGSVHQPARGEPTRSPSAKKEAVSDEDLKAAIPVPAGRGEEGVTVPIRGAEKASEGVTALQPSMRVVQSRASAPGPAKGVAKGDLRVDEGRQEFSQYSTAGKRLDVPASQFARKGSPEPGDDPSGKWFQPKSLDSGGSRLQAGPETGTAGKDQPRLTSVAKAGQVASVKAGEYRASSSAPGSRQPGPAASEPRGTGRSGDGKGKLNQWRWPIARPSRCAADR